MDADYLRDAYAYAARTVVDAPPIFWNPRNRGHWVIAGYEAAHAASSAWEVFSSRIFTLCSFAAVLN
jgi:hypothetical protein